MIMDQLTKSSTSEEIKEYFNAILALKEKNELYPVNIDDGRLSIQREGKLHER